MQRDFNVVTLNLKKQMMNATAMTYSTSRINRDFRIKVYGYNNSDERLNLLVGVSGLIRLVGEELADTLVKSIQKQSFRSERESRMQAASRSENNFLSEIIIKTQNDMRIKRQTPKVSRERATVIVA